VVKKSYTRGLYSFFLCPFLEGRNGKYAICPIYAKSD
jgi:hypothetical protein